MNRSGQSQLLFVVVMSIAAITTALYGLDRSSSNQKKTVTNLRRSQMRSALESTARQIQYIYQTLSSCNPQLLDQKLSRLCTDGTLHTTGTSLCSNGEINRRRLKISEGGQWFVVFIGKVTPLGQTSGGTSYDTWNTNPSGLVPTTAVMPVDTWQTTEALMPSNDAMVEIWTSWGDTKVAQKIALVNRCTYRCAYALPNASCDYGMCSETAGGQPIDARTGYAQLNANATTNLACNFQTITVATSAPAQNWTVGSLGSVAGNSASGRYLTSCRLANQTIYQATANILDVADLLAMKEKLRTGVWRHFDPTLKLNATWCVDANRDGAFNELDLDIFEKHLRGYLLQPAVNGHSPPGGNWNTGISY